MPGADRKPTSRSPDTRSPDSLALESESRTTRVPVLLPYPFAGPFDYAVPAELDLAPGDVVLVPLNRREEVGVVWDGPSDAPVPTRKRNPVAARPAPPGRAEPMRRFIDWIAAYTLAPPGEV